MCVFIPVINLFQDVEEEEEDEEDEELPRDEL